MIKPSIKHLARAAAAIVALSMAATVQAEIYKWTDQNGKVQYSQTPPAGVNATAIMPAPPPPNAGQPDAALKQRLKGFEERREARKKSEAQQVEDKEAEKVRAENCQRARGNLTALQSHGQVSLKEGDTYRKLTEDERQVKISEAEAHIEEFCKKEVAVEK
jgi:hypothetical protein